MPLPFRVIIAGGRDFEPSAQDYETVAKLTSKYYDYHNKQHLGRGLEFITGTARGADMMPYTIYEERGVPYREFPAPWDDTSGKTSSQIGYRSNGTEYWKGAGHYRNAQMADVADALILFWDGKSTGSRNMLKTMEKLGKPVRVIKY